VFGVAEESELTGERKPISKGTRFEIFRRDRFTCQYCGRRPPEVVLEVDHIIAVAEGGGNDDMNLVTSCVDCNRGKGKKRLETLPRPDADDAWVEMQQEIAELERYQEAKLERDSIRSDVIWQLGGLWCEMMGLDWCPHDRIMNDWLSKFGPELVEQAIRTVAPKVASGYVSADGAIPYTRATLNKMAEQR
jgi:hypothetical protein